MKTTDMKTIYSKGKTFFFFFQQNPKKSLDQDLAPQKSHAEFPNLNGIQYTAKSKNGWFGNWSLVTGHWAFGLDCSQSPIFS